MPPRRRGEDDEEDAFASAGEDSVSGSEVSSDRNSGVLDPERLAAMIDDWHAQISLAFFLTGCADIATFRRCEAVIRGAG